jgi:integrase/recombinase XerC
MTISQQWAEWIDGYLASQRAAGYPITTRNTRRQHLQHLARTIGTDPGQLSAEQLVSWAGDRDWAPSTRRTRRATFQSFFAWARDSKLRKGDPARALRKIRQPTASPRPVPGRIYHEALIRADEIETIWLELAYDHGMRRAEIAQVHTGRDIIEDFVGHSLLVHGKGDKDRTVPLTPRMARHLLEREPGWLLTGCSTATGRFTRCATTPAPGGTATAACS